MRRFKLFLFTCFLWQGALFANPEPDLVSLGAGVFDIMREKYRTAEFRVEYKFHHVYWVIQPLIGFMATAKGATYLYTGFGLDFIIKERFFFTPNFAAGWYRQGGGKNLGFPLEFRSGIEAGWRFKNCYRLGAHFYHISNASLGSRNPGEESLVFFLCIPVGRCFSN